ncbi:MAG: AAA family ATPase [Chloroflexi bacterium]|nr:AAA family ATPase [Chloroflexota bacterium]
MGTISSPLLVGRDQELALLEGSLAHVLGGEAAIVVIDGDAGVGKSRLVEALPLARRRAAAASLSADA